MNHIGILWRRELAAFLHSPAAYVTMTVVLVVTGAVFWGQATMTRGEPARPDVLLFWPLTLWIMVIAVCAVVTMRLFAEEKRSGTFETLMTAPVSEVDVVLAKFAAAFTVFAIVFAPTALYLPVLRRFSTGLEVIDMRPIASGYAILLLVGAFYLSVGLFASALSRSQIVAAITSFAALSLVFSAGLLTYLFPGHSGDLMDTVSAFKHIMDFARGAIDAGPVILYLSGTGLMLFATMKVVEARRWV